MVSSVKTELRKKYPKWTSEKIDSTAYAITQKHWKDKYGKPAFN